MHHLSVLCEPKYLNTNKIALKVQTQAHTCTHPCIDMKDTKYASNKYKGKKILNFKKLDERNKLGATSTCIHWQNYFSFIRLTIYYFHLNCTFSVSNNKLTEVRIHDQC